MISQVNPDLRLDSLRAYRAAMSGRRAGYLAITTQPTPKGYVMLKTFNDAAFDAIVAPLVDVRQAAAQLATLYAQPTISHVPHTFMIAATSRS